MLWDKKWLTDPCNVLQDISVALREVERWQEEVKVQEAKACVAASRLKAEVRETLLT